MGNYFWFNRLSVFCLWQKTKSNYSDVKRHRANGVSLFYFKYIYYDSVRYCFSSIALFYKNMRPILKRYKYKIKETACVCHFRQNV